MDILNILFNLVLALVGGGSLVLFFLNAIVPALFAFIFFIILDIVKEHYFPKPVLR